ncbi:MAG: hypothetical protein QM286_11840 [Acidobacteriota bacterium]|nr:hypothetical protein [Acidobacteriota bacterium]NLH69101.1 hypothetical protein [Brooklawnia sp.]
MSDTVIISLVSTGLGIIAALWALLMWNSRQSPRYIVRAVGIVLVVVGAFVTGLSDLLLQGVRGVIDWVRHKPMDTVTWVGVGVGVLGVVAFLIGGFIKAPTREEAKQRLAARAAKDRERLAAQAAKIDKKQAKQAPTTPPQPPPLPSASQQAGPAGSTPANADDEVTNILKKHGIE